MAIYKSSNSNYTGLTCYENRNLLSKIQNRFKGYVEIPLNLSDFIIHNNLDMILNNDIINYETFDIYNFEDLYETELKEIEESIEDYIDLKEVNNDEDLTEIIEEQAIENIYNIEVYQYFIVSEYDIKNYWIKYTNYPIYYNNELDLYLIGITHYGMSWDYFGTSFKIRQYL